METLRHANQQTQPIQTKSARSCQSDRASINTHPQQHSDLIMLFSNGTEKLKKQISQGFPSLVLCIVVAQWQDAGLCTVIQGVPKKCPLVFYCF